LITCLARKSCSHTHTHTHTQRVCEKT